MQFTQYTHTNPDGSRIRFEHDCNMRISIARDVTLSEGLMVEGEHLTIDEGVKIGPNVRLSNATIGTCATVGTQATVVGCLPPDAILKAYCHTSMPNTPKRFFGRFVHGQFVVEEGARLVITEESYGLGDLHLGKGSELIVAKVLSGGIQLPAGYSVELHTLEEIDFLYMAGGHAIQFRRGNALKGRYDAFSPDEQVMFEHICRMQSAYERTLQKVRDDLAAANGRLKKQDATSLEGVAARVTALEAWRQAMEAGQA